MPSISLLRPLLGLLALAAVTGCGPGERPPAGGDLDEDDSPPLFVATPLEPIARSAVCAPGMARACRLYILDDGVLSCPLSAQLCRTDGLGWLPCGAPPRDDGPPPAKRATDATDAPMFVH